METARKVRSRKPRPQECGEGEIEGIEKASHLGMDAVSALIPLKDDKKHTSDIDDVKTGDEREVYQTDNANYTSMSEACFTED